MLETSQRFTKGFLSRSSLTVFPPPSVPQRAVCHRQAMQREKHRSGIRRQVHQEASEHGQLSRGEAGGDRAGGGHPATDPAPQHRHSARCLREPDRRGAHPGAVSDCRSNSRIITAHLFT